jgi:hypothetical protein
MAVTASVEMGVGAQPGILPVRATDAQRDPAATGAGWQSILASASRDSDAEKGDASRAEQSGEETTPSEGAGGARSTAAWPIVASPAAGGQPNVNLFARGGLAGASRSSLPMPSGNSPNRLSPLPPAPIVFATSEPGLTPASPDGAANGVQAKADETATSSGPQPKQQDQGVSEAEAALNLLAFAWSASVASLAAPHQQADFKSPVGPRAEAMGPAPAALPAEIPQPIDRGRSEALGLTWAKPGSSGEAGASFPSQPAAGISSPHEPWFGTVAGSGISNLSQAPARVPPPSDARAITEDPSLAAPGSGATPARGAVSPGSESAGGVSGRAAAAGSSSAASSLAAPEQKAGVAGAPNNPLDAVPAGQPAPVAFPVFSQPQPAESLEKPNASGGAAVRRPRETGAPMPGMQNAALSEVQGGAGGSVAPTGMRVPVILETPTSAPGRDGFHNEPIPTAPRSDAFAELDVPAPGTAPTWVRAGAQHAEAGYQDPALGWVSVRAEAAGGQVHASLIPGSDEAATALGGHLAGLGAFLAEHHAQVASLSVALPDARHEAADSSQSGNHLLQQGQGGEQNPERRQAFAAPQSTADARADSPAVAIEEMIMAEPMEVSSPGYALPAGNRISVMA